MAVSLEMWKLAEAEFFPSNEGSMSPSISETASLRRGRGSHHVMKGHRSEPGGPTGSAGLVSGGGTARDSRSVPPSRGRESDWLIVPMTPRRKRGEPREGAGRRELPEEAGVRTQSRVALPPNLVRVNAAARRAAQARFTALLRAAAVSVRPFPRSATRVTLGRSRVRESRMPGTCEGESRVAELLDRDLILYSFDPGALDGSLGAIPLKKSGLK